MNPEKKPYLVVPFLIEQSTWGGSYIFEKKRWTNKSNIKGKKIGQSYELFDRSLLAKNIISTNDDQFSPDTKDTLPISTFMEERPFPLIKFTQAKGNSFQLHIKPEIKDKRWIPKAESWYFLEDGKVTFGLKKGVDLDKYKESCFSINNKMKELSKKLIQKEIVKEQGEEEAKAYILAINPWQYVNTYNVKKGDVVDLSGGGLHHSWEEDSIHCPQGNIVYEVQQDVMDPKCTIRAFDQGKFKEDGTIREIQVEDYFKYIDSDEKKNTLSI